MIESIIPTAVPEFEETRILGGAVVCFQPKRGYRSAIDPILMQAAVEAEDGQHVLDLGCGAGAAALSLAHRRPNLEISGLDIQPELVALAELSAKANGISDRVGFHAGDLLDPPKNLAKTQYQVVMANPPFMKAGTSRPSPDPIKAMATIEGHALLEDWVRAAHELLVPAGRAVFIHQGTRSNELLDLMIQRFGQIRCLPILARASDEVALRILIEGTKGSDAQDNSQLPPLVLHKNDGTYTNYVNQILRGREAISLGAKKPRP